MNLQKLNPWNWFKHEEGQGMNENIIPVKKSDYSKPIFNKNSILELHHEIDKLFDQAFQNLGFSYLPRTRFNNSVDKAGRLDFFNPDLNISSDDKEYIIILEAAGLEEKDITIELTDRRLSIKGNKQEESENKDKDFYRIERKFGSFQRVLALPEDALSDQIKAGMKNGLLTIKVPRNEAQSANTRKITISNS